MMTMSRAPLPAVLFAVTMGAGWLAGVAMPFELPLSFVARLAAGLSFLAAGASLGFLALGEMRRANTTAEPNSTPAALVTRGPFRFSRNPIYIADVLVALGLALMFASAWMTAGAIAFAAALNWLVIPAEERMLAVQFADAYAAYRRRVRRWF